MNETKEDLLLKIEKLEKEVSLLKKDLIHDALTGLKTRSYFEEKNNIYISSLSHTIISKRHKWFGFKDICFLFVDIDHFKKVNDTFGHDTGDLVLKEVSNTIQNAVRIGDTVARWGGEEIVVSLLGANESESKIKAEEIREKISNLSFDFNPDFHVTVSIGVARTVESSTMAELVSRADKALYKAKNSGRNKVVVFSELEE